MEDRSRKFTLSLDQQRAYALKLEELATYGDATALHACLALNHSGALAKLTLRPKKKASGG